ncbi:MAG: AarF/ABC1/UbiB kinase family protein [Nitrospirota bacterium]
MKIRYCTRFLKGLVIALRIVLSYKLASAITAFMSPERSSAFLGRLHRRNAVLLREKALEMKGLMIKVGQFLSSRIDFLPDEYIAELSQLQDRVPPHDYAEIRQQLVRSLGAPPETVFLQFDETPLAAASLGQVHRAVLKSGEPVAVKVQYPAIGPIIETDIRMLRSLVALLGGRYGRIDLKVLHDEFSRIVRSELDYLQEGRNAERFGDNFKDDDRVVIPEVKWEHTTSQVLTLEFVEGVKITDCGAAREPGLDCKEVVNLLAETYATMIFVHGFFHGDPHPGNIFVREGPKLVFVDFGMVQAIPGETRRLLRRFALAVVERDVAGILDTMERMGFIIAGADYSAVREVARSLFERYRDISPTALKALTVDDIGAEIERIIGVVDYLQIPNNFILLGRTISMLNGIAFQLNPDINIIEIGTPYIRQFLRGTRREEVGHLLAGLRDRLIDLWKLPGLLGDFLSKANRGELLFRLPRGEMHHLTGQLKTMTSVMMLVVLTVTTATSSLLFIILDNRPLTLLAAGTSIFLGLLAVIKLMRG